MKNISFILLFAALIGAYSSSAQTFKYWVSFTDKAGTPYSVSTPTAYLSPKSILRRTNQGIAINVTDLPVTPSYVSQVDAVPTTTVLYRSKWLNGIVVLTNSVSITAINSLTFVASTTKANKVKVTVPYEDQSNIPPPSANKTGSITSYNYGASNWQQKMMQTDCLHNQGYRGQGMTIAIMDIGFYDAQNNPVFDSLFAEGRVLGTRDFVNGDTTVFEDNTELHGGWCLSTMAGNIPGKIVGTAPKAKYWLLKTEDGYSESISEEYNWIRAVEFADSVGADITTTSLIYNQFDGGLNDHVYADLNGKKAPMTIAANMAARKGMIVLNGAGNEGTSPWYYICVPADADSIITVGAVDSMGVHANFSSYGPSADGRIKPDLSSRGANALVCGPGANCFYGNGTSFATPIMAGATACLWQYKNFAKNMQIITAMKNTATNTSSPNNSIGWGIPQLCNAAASLGTAGVKEIAFATTYNIFPNPCNDHLNIDLGDNKGSVMVRITDALGKKVLEQYFTSPTQIISVKEVASLSNGFYIVDLLFADHSSSIKFSKNN